MSRRGASGWGGIVGRCRRVGSGGRILTLQRWYCCRKEKLLSHRKLERGTHAVEGGVPVPFAHAQRMICSPSTEAPPAYSSVQETWSREYLLIPTSLLPTSTLTKIPDKHYTAFVMLCFLLIKASVYAFLTSRLHHPVCDQGRVSL
jgi:hypothetical protein